MTDLRQRLIDALGEHVDTIKRVDDGAKYAVPTYEKACYCGETFGRFSVEAASDDERRRAAHEAFKRHRADAALAVFVAYLRERAAELEAVPGGDMLVWAPDSDTLNHEADAIEQER